MTCTEGICFFIFSEKQLSSQYKISIKKQQGQKYKNVEDRERKTFAFSPQVQL